MEKEGRKTQGSTSATNRGGGEDTSTSTGEEEKLLALARAHPLPPVPVAVSSLGFFSRSLSPFILALFACVCECDHPTKKPKF